LTQAIIQPGTVASSNASIAAGVTITGNIGLGSYGGGAYGALLAPAALGAVTIFNAGVIDAAGTRPGALEVGILLAGGGWLGNAGTIEVTGTAKIGYAIEALAGASVTNAGVIAGFGGIYAAGGVVSNSGLIDVSADGINLAGGAVTNNSSGTIISTAKTSGRTSYAAIGNTGSGSVSVSNAGLLQGVYFAVDLSSAAVVSNSGSIVTSFALGDGILLGNGGTILNRGVISGGYLGAALSGGVDVVINSGTITGSAPARPFHPHIGTGLGIYSTIANSLTNLAGGVIAGAQMGVRTGGAAATIINAGTITGGTMAVGFAAGFANRLVLEPGAQFSGLVDGGNMLGAAIGSVLELAGTSAGMIANFGTFTDFATIVIDPGASWTLSNFTLAPGQSITSTGKISVAMSGNAETISAAPMACFAAGTRILGARGEVAVEDLRVGDLVILPDGSEAPVQWIGRRAIDLARHPAPEKAQPVRIAAEAMADGIPARDLLLSPDHALWFENCLIPVKALVNGRNVTQERRRFVVYYHIELAAHGILFAEAVGCESYLETGNRGCFENAPVADLHADFAPAEFQAMREAKSCFPFVECGPVVERLRGILIRRAFMAPGLRRGWPLSRP